MTVRSQKIAENAVYYLIWLTVFAVTVIGYTEDGKILWDMVGRFWIRALPLIVLFLFNNYFLIPKLLLRKRYGGYNIAVLASILAVAAFTLVTHPKIKPGDFPPPEAFRNGERPRMEMTEYFPEEGVEETLPAERRPLGDRHSDGEFRRPPKPFIFKWGPAFGVLLFSFFIVGINIAIKLIFKTVNDSRLMEQMERQSLRAELDYLKAQVNPHFFMNTLNNIHALVDIDTEKAKETIIELSKIMRYILYDTDKTFVSVKLEVKFIQNYVSLMSMRYSGNISIETVYPDFLPEAKIAPLLLITLVENAFKHGISYRKESFIKTVLEIKDQRLIYTVINSLPDKPLPDKGMGLENMRKRLFLLYGDNYSLDLSPDNGNYVAVLDIPLLM